MPITFISQPQKLDERSFEIFEALDYDNSESADYFKEKCAEVPSQLLICLRDKRLGNEGRTLLHNAARKGSLPAVLSLIRAGHAPEAWDSCVSRLTPLMEAIKYGHIEVAIVLIEAGAKLSTCDINNENGLHYVARMGSVRMLKNLITASRLSPDMISLYASQQNIKKKVPEDLTRNEKLVVLLSNLRVYGSLTGGSGLSGK